MTGGCEPPASEGDCSRGGRQFQGELGFGQGPGSVRNPGYQWAHGRERSGGAGSCSSPARSFCRFFPASIAGKAGHREQLGVVERRWRGSAPPGPAAARQTSAVVAKYPTGSRWPPAGRRSEFLLPTPTAEAAMAGFLNQLRESGLLPPPPGVRATSAAALPGPGYPPTVYRQCGQGFRPRAPGPGAPAELRGFRVPARQSGSDGRILARGAANRQVRRPRYCLM